MPTKTRTARYAVFGLEVIENVGLIIIGLATVVAGFHEVALMVENGKVTLADLLLMFLYLEVLTMVGLYYNSGKLPVRFPLYIAMVALARYLILDIKELDVWRMLAVSGSVLLIALAVLVIRYGHVRFPYAEDAGRAVDRPPQPGNE
jgi:protein PsiE